MMPTLRVRTATHFPGFSPLRLPSVSHPASAGGQFSQRWAYVALLAASWLITHPYFGIVHDARLYTIQALHALDPERLKSDLYFLFGSQDNFTIFAALFERIIAALGVGPANVAATFTGQAIWVSTFIFLLRSLLDRGMVLPALAGVILLHSDYGGLRIFHYAENFATPRLLSEALVFLALGCAVRRHFAAAGAITILAAAIHPLMTLPAAGVLFLLAAKRYPWIWSMPLVGTVIALTLATYGVEPFGRLLQRFDSEWLRITLDRNAFAFILKWRLTDYIGLGAQLSIAIAGVLSSGPSSPAGRLTRLILGIACLALLTSLVTADLLDDVLATNLQLWRAAWLLSVIANVWTIVLIVTLPAESFARRLMIVGALISATMHLLGIANVFSAPVLLSAGAIAIFEILTKRQIHRLAQLALIALTVADVVFTLAAGVGFVVFNYDSPQSAQQFAAAATGLVAFTLLLCASDYGHRRSFCAAAFVVLVSAIAVLDQRSSWTSFVESGVEDRSLRDFVADAGPTYWEQGIDINWFKLRRPNYYACLQGTGAMFFRGTAEEYERRRRGLATLNSLDFIGSADGLCGASPDEFTPGPQSLKQIGQVCNDLPDLATLILRTKIPEGNPAQWRAPALRYVDVLGTWIGADIFYRYDCKVFR